MKRQGQISVDSKNIFPIIKKWLYSDQDIFLRELVSNGCDAIHKFNRLVSLGEAEAPEGWQPRIQVLTDPEHHLLRIEDNGIGMTADEVERYITQVAFSGAEEFLQKYQEKSDGDAGIIGHFGLGFYSAYMVASQVEIDTLSYQPGAQPVHWVSDGNETYEISDGTRTTQGTTITLHLTEEAAEFAQENRIRELLYKYCQFMPYEIYLNPAVTQRTLYGDDGKPQLDETGKEKTEEVQPSPVNDTHPLWLKAPRECTEQEYKDFYAKTFLDYNEPLFWIHLNVDYPFNLKGILYFPRQNNRLEVMPGQVKLYSNQVFVADNIKEIIPEFLLLLKGVIDCPDMPLNVSRSFLQNDAQVQKIAAHITKKVSDKLHQIFKEDRAAYEGYWNDISAFIKFGCIKDESFYHRIRDIILLKTIDGEYKTLDEYPKQEGGKIYYVTDEDLQSQYIRMFRENGLTAAVLTHAIDPHFISLLEYITQADAASAPKDADPAPQPLHFLRIDADIGEALRQAPSEEEKTSQEEQNKPLVEAFQSALDPKLTIQAQSLKSAETPAVLLLSEYARRIQDMNRIYGENFAALDPELTLVLNTANPIIQKIPSLSGETRDLVCRQIYDLALLSNRPLTADQLSDFIQRSVRLLDMVSGENN